MCMKADYSNTYWNNKGEHQDLYNSLWEGVPSQGKTGFVGLEVLRASSSIYHDFYNNGCCNDKRTQAALLIDNLELTNDEIKLLLETSGEGCQSTYMNISQHQVDTFETIATKAIMYANEHKAVSSDLDACEYPLGDYEHMFTDWSDAGDFSDDLFDDEE